MGRRAAERQDSYKNTKRTSKSWENRKNGKMIDTSKITNQWECSNIKTK